MTLQDSERSRKVITAQRRLLAQARRLPEDRLVPESMWSHMVESVPFGDKKCLAYFAFILARCHQFAVEGKQDDLRATVDLGCLFAEQVAVQGGTDYALAWSMTGIEEPPWTTLEAHRPRPLGHSSALPHAMLADPTWVATNLQHLTDLGALADRTAAVAKRRAKSGNPGKDKEEA